MSNTSYLVFGHTLIVIQELACAYIAPVGGAPNALGTNYVLQFIFHNGLQLMVPPNPDACDYEVNSYALCLDELRTINELLNKPQY